MILVWMVLLSSRDEVSRVIQLFLDFYMKIILAGNILWVDSIC